MKICTVVGARPQFVKAAVVSRAIAEVRGSLPAGSRIHEDIVHTGQHYDASLSQVFFDELGIPGPVVNLEVGSASHATQTGLIMERLESWLLGRAPYDWLLVYGDTNSTLAAALVAAKLGVRLAHVEAGLRSFDDSMPEEINRVVTDRLADLLLCPTNTAVTNLRNAGVRGKIVETGDVMYDATTSFRDKAANAEVPSSLQDLKSSSYVVATVHRAENADADKRMKAIIDALHRIEGPVVFVAHPRIRRHLDGREPDGLRILEPLGYLQMLRLVDRARLIVTDSGGLQKEAYWLGTPCITLRRETEWVETLAGKWNQLADADPEKIVSMSRDIPSPAAERPAFGVVEGKSASAAVVSELLTFEK